MHILENDFLRIKIKNPGAELCSIFHKKNNIEYLWQADAAYWGKHAPVLFPIVGQLKDNEYFFQDKKFKLERHGFARTSEFKLQNHFPDRAEFVLQENEGSLALYPFHFNFIIGYQLDHNKLVVSYKIKNTGETPMYFSVGGHPAFNVPLQADEKMEDYEIIFHPKAPEKIFPLENGLLKDQPEPFYTVSDSMRLSKDLFYNDAFVFKNTFFESVELLNSKSGMGIKMHCEGFPYFGIWSAKSSDFICLEPWLGIADSISSRHILEEKEGIKSLSPSGNFTADYTIEIL